MPSNCASEGRALDGRALEDRFVDAFRDILRLIRDDALRSSSSFSSDAILNFSSISCVIPAASAELHSSLSSRNRQRSSSFSSSLLPSSCCPTPLMDFLREMAAALWHRRTEGVRSPFTGGARSSPSWVDLERAKRFNLANISDMDGGDGEWGQGEACWFRVRCS